MAFDKQSSRIEHPAHHSGGEHHLDGARHEVESAQRGAAKQHRPPESHAKKEPSSLEMTNPYKKGDAPSAPKPPEQPAGKPQDNANDSKTTRQNYSDRNQVSKEFQNDDGKRMSPDDPLLKWTPPAKPEAPKPEAPKPESKPNPGIPADVEKYLNTPSS